MTEQDYKLLSERFRNENDVLRAEHRRVLTELEIAQDVIAQQNVDLDRLRERLRLALSWQSDNYIRSLEAENVRLRDRLGEVNAAD